LVVSEVALALVLLVGAGLLVRSFRALLGVDRGFDSHNTTVATLQTWSYYPTPALRVGYSRDATERLAALPGVTAAGMTSSLPLAVPIGQERAGIRIEGQPPSRDGEVPTAHVTATTPGFFDALRIPLREGRMLTRADGDGDARVAVVNETFARRFFPAGSAIGQRVAFAFMGPPVMREIVGVVGDVRHDGPASSTRPSVFVPHAHAPTGAMHLVVRTTGDPRVVERAVRAELTALNGVMPLSDMTTLDALLGGSLRERRFHLSLLGAFSVMALVLAAVGIYGLVSTATSARTHEIGVRVAIGARASDVSWMVLRQGAVLTIAGIAIGVVGAFGLTRLLRGMLFHITPLDALTFGGASALLVLAATVACWIPARRAAAVDPIAALRE
jgi:putative ABC transport system permease protein